MIRVESAAKLLATTRGCDDDDKIHMRVCKVANLCAIAYFL